ITNDDEKFTGHRELELKVTLEDVGSKKNLSSQSLGRIPDLAYFQTEKIPVRFKVPPIGSPRQKVRLLFQLVENNSELSRTTALIEIFEKPAGSEPIQANATAISLGGALEGLAKKLFVSVSSDIP